MSLESNYGIRCQSARSNEKLVLVTLRISKFSDAKTLSFSIDKSISYTYKILTRLHKKGLVKRHYVCELNICLWGVTEQGVLLSWENSEDIRAIKLFEPSKVSPISIYHELQLQRARSQALKADWHSWIPGHLIDGEPEKRPDALVVSDLGEKVAIELERTVKSRKRYEVIISHYLQAIKRGEYDYVAYVIPNIEMAIRMPKLFRSIKSVPVAGRRVNLEERHYNRFHFFFQDKWPYAKEEL